MEAVWFQIGTRLILLQLLGFFTGLRSLLLLKPLLVVMFALETIFVCLISGASGILMNYSSAYVIEPVLSLEFFKGLFSHGSEGVRASESCMS